MLAVHFHYRDHCRAFFVLVWLRKQIFINLSLVACSLPAEEWFLKEELSFVAHNVYFAVLLLESVMNVFLLLVKLRIFRYLYVCWCLRGHGLDIENLSRWLGCLEGLSHRVVSRRNVAAHIVWSVISLCLTVVQPDGLLPYCVIQAVVCAGLALTLSQQGKLMDCGGIVRSHGVLALLLTRVHSGLHIFIESLLQRLLAGCSPMQDICTHLTAAHPCCTAFQHV